MAAFKPHVKGAQSASATEAVQWFLRIQNGQLSEAEQARFDGWHAVPNNAAAYAKAGRIWGAIGEVASEPEVLQVRERILAKTDRHRFWLTAGIAAGVAAMTVGALLLTNIGEPFLSRLRALLAPAAVPEAIHATSVGERSTVTLRDGSILTLNTDSAAEVRFNEHERQIVLVRGQALFEVAKHQARPFVVYAGDRRVEATGTAFDVRVDSARVEVTLVEGRVQVGESGAVPGSRGRARSVALSPGERLVAHAGAPVSVTRANLDQVTSWTAGKLIFLDTRLDDAIAEVNRYTRTPIGLADESLAALRVSGVFRVGQPAEFARAVVQIHPLEVEYAPNGQIHIVARSM